MHAGAAKAFVTVLIVALTLTRIAQNLIGLCAFLELGFGFFIIRVLVRMILHRQTPIHALDLVGRSIFAHAQDFVVVPFGHILVSRIS